MSHGNWARHSPSLVVLQVSFTLISWTTADFSVESWKTLPDYRRLFLPSPARSLRGDSGDIQHKGLGFCGVNEAHRQPK